MNRRRHGRRLVDAAAARTVGDGVHTSSPEGQFMFDFRSELVGQNQDVVKVVLAGILEESNCDSLLRYVEDQVRAGRRKLVLDCGQISFISSMGLGTLVRVNSRMKTVGGDVMLAAVHGPVAEVVRVVGLHRIFEIFPTADDAVAALGG
jgi:anti-sigma B factor antagonist